MDQERLGTIIRQLQQVNDSVRAAAAAAVELRLLRQARNEDRGEAWRHGERLSIGLSDAEHVLSFLVDWLEIGVRAVEAAPGVSSEPAPRREKSGYRLVLCQCGGRHRDFQAVAECIWPQAIWVQGNGPWVTLARCKALSVMLHRTVGDARESLDTIRFTGCGGDCYNDHELVVLSQQQIGSPARGQRAQSGGMGASPRAVALDPRRTFSAMQKQEILLRSNGHCASCGQELGLDWHADHIYPHSLGGVTEIVNGQSLCRPCNSRKSAKVLVVDQ